jgi:anti-sigma factor RsiW
VTGDCPASGELLACALARPGEDVSEAIARHVSACPACGAELRRLREAAGALRSVATPSGADAEACLDELTIASFVDGELPAAERPDVMAHLAGCPRCRAQVASVGRLLQDSSVASAQCELEKPLPAHPGLRLGIRRRVAGASALIGLAAGFILVVVRSDAPTRSVADEAPTPGTQVLREQAITSTGAPRLIAPMGIVQVADTLRWTSVPHADRYRVTVFDREGTVVREEQTADTTLALPATLGATHGRLYLWKVEARTGWDRWVASELVEFTLSPAPMPQR